MAQTTNDKIYQAVDTVRKEANTNYDKIYTKVDHLETKIESNYITRSEFDASITPIRLISYGLIGIFATGLVGIAIAWIGKAIK